MPVIAWSNNFDTGISIVDSQHKVLVGMINQIQRASEEPDPQIRNLMVGLNLDHLVQYTVYHFEFEEKLMEAAGYEGLAEHQKSHDDLKSEVMDYMKKFKSGEDITLPLLNFLKYWLQGHILKEDMNFAPDVKKLEQK